MSGDRTTASPPDPPAHFTPSRSIHANDGLDAAKIAAIVLMTINHVLLAWPEPLSIIGYLVGRPCVAIFAFIMLARLADGPPQRAERMLARLCVWALIAQVPYYLLTSEWPLRANILVTLAIGAALIVLWQRRATTNWVLVPIVAIAIGLPFADRWLDGGAFIPIAQLLGFMVYRRSPGAALAIIVMTAAAQNLLSTPSIPVGALATLVAALLVWPSPRLAGITPRVPSWLFYAFYPAHLLAIWLLFGHYP
ncbi:MAG: conjugal transfer protein TrbP [Xanthobacteraceae bacterium]|nr:conjugal transfer protein TrbP [Xanthobacteraceae bacterium]